MRLIEMAWPAQFAGDESQMLASQRKNLEPRVAAIGHYDDGFGFARVQPDPVRAVQFACLFTLPSPGTDVLGFRVVLMDPTQAVAVRDIHVPIGRDGNVGGLVFFLSIVDAGFFRIAEYPHTLAVESGLRDQMALGVGEV